MLYQCPRRLVKITLPLPNTSTNSTMSTHSSRHAAATPALCSCTCNAGCRKHVLSMGGTGVTNPAARLFSNPAGDYGSMVNERVGAGNWESGQELGDTWASRNAFSYGRCALQPSLTLVATRNVSSTCH